ncbi:MAG: pyrimidine 5'-nucleotidase [Anaerolineales bacterium]|jgi:putative hydrolase of the HAD superfamily
MTAYSTLFVDLDQTVYPATSGIWEDVTSRITRYLEQHFGLSTKEAMALRAHYFENYGTTLRGLQLETGVDPVSYMEFIHDVPVERKIVPDPELKTLLQSVQLPKYIFTNASAEHAERILRQLGVADCFDDIIDIIRLGYANKPDPEAYRLALGIAGNPEPGTCVLIDDSIPNLITGMELGMKTVQIGLAQDDTLSPDFQIASIHNLFDVLPELKASHPNKAARSV